MKNYARKIVLILIGVLVIGGTVTAQKGKGGGASGTSCADVAVPTLSTSTASAGINVGVFSRVGNCSGSKKRYVVKVSAVSSCSQETQIASNIISFDPGQYKLISLTYAVQPGTCVGSSRISVSVYDGDTLLGTQSGTLTIQ